MARESRRGTGKPTQKPAFAAAISSRQVPQILSTVLDRLDEDRREEVRLEAKRTRTETEMLAADLERLVEKHGKDHPRVRRVQAARISLDRQAKLAEATLRRIETLKPPENGGWTATGRVWNPDGAPLSGVSVEFVASGGKAPDLKTTTTDEEGEFYLTYSSEIVKSLIQNDVRLSLVVRKDRTILYRDSNSFSVLPNAVHQFRVRLSKPKSGQEKH